MSKFVCPHCRVSVSLLNRCSLQETLEQGGGGGGLSTLTPGLGLLLLWKRLQFPRFSPQIGYHLLSLFTLIKTGYLPKMCLLTLQSKNGLVIGKQVLRLMLLNFHCHKSDIKLTYHAFCFLLEPVEYHQLFWAGP